MIVGMMTIKKEQDWYAKPGEVEMIRSVEVLVGVFIGVVHIIQFNRHRLVVRNRDSFPQNRVAISRDQVAIIRLLPMGCIGPADHIYIDVAYDLPQGNGTIVDKMLRSEQPLFFAGKQYEQQTSAVSYSLPGQTIEHRRYA